MNEYVYEIGGKKYEVKINDVSGSVASVKVNGEEYRVDIKTEGLPPIAALQPPQGGGAPAAPAAPMVPVSAPSAGPAPAPTAAPKSAPAAAGAVTAPMPGTVLKILVNQGDAVNPGDVLLIIEAMKMENEIKASGAGTVEKILVSVGDNVSVGRALIKIG